MKRQLRNGNKEGNKKKGKKKGIENKCCKKINKKKIWLKNKYKINTKK